MAIPKQPRRRNIQQLFGMNPDAGIMAQNTQTLEGAGAILPSAEVVFFTSTGSDALTLVDATRKGQVITVRHCTDGGSGTLTAGSSLHLAYSPTATTGIASIALADVNDWVDLMWTGKAYIPIRHGGTGVTITRAT
jgi:hypothetical protein